MTPASQALLHPVHMVSAAGWLYPFKGIWYFSTHSYLWPLLKGRILPCFLLSIFVLANLFIWTYLPQVAFLYFFQDKTSAWVNGTFLVLSESAAIVATLFECFFVDETQVDIFDAVLVDRGYEALVRAQRPVGPPGESPLQRLGKQEKHAVFAPFSLRQIVEFIVLLPLNFIPWFGVPLFIFLTGYRAGRLTHWRYYKFLGLEHRSQRKAFIRQYGWKYTWFGTASLFLQLIPVLNMFFLLSSTVGSALLAADFEKQREPPMENDEDDAPPPYTEYATYGSV
ncbi:uncharacterized protein K452DRAFT_240689 [Aplosporella prunicola CBS 121167]|uniref:Uncharacterized protein n=1 Tax=Aplosporella prunicola CBS 121167 TaxID=1176127 RepID=A0A6A6BVF6_9PEZI|nr:uncharacterized protein K452DRAFT_240689 [Aplosporella prunicola CBS 121167]KAF2147313.1 hypothetical protein K452DRAFT_240689 [Aplosporella prunicola CBS 121167]